MRTIRGLRGATLAALLGVSAALWAQATVPVTVVVKDRTGEAIPLARVQIASRPDQPASELYTGVTGALTVGLNPGAYDLQVVSPGFESSRNQISVAGAMTIPIVLNVTNVMNAPLVVPEPVSLSLQVNGRGRTAVPDARVGISHVPGSWQVVLDSDAKGHATLQLTPGLYDMTISKDGYFADWRRVNLLDSTKVVASLDPIPPSSGDEYPTANVLPRAETDDSASSTVLLDQPGQPRRSDVLVITAGPHERGVFTPATLKDYPHVTVTVYNPHIKKTETWSGVPLIDLLAPLGVPHGKTLMSKALATYIVATGSDGYKTVVALAEIDPSFHPGVVLIADTLDGKPLGTKTGPFRLVISLDKKPARSVRNLVSIEVKSAYP